MADSPLTYQPPDDRGDFTEEEVAQAFTPELGPEKAREIARDMYSMPRGLIFVGDTYAMLARVSPELASRVAAVAARVSPEQRKRILDQRDDASD